MAGLWTRQRAVAVVAVIAGLALSLAPLSAAGAQFHSLGAHHAVSASHSKGLCNALRAEQTSANNIGNSISRALQAGNFNRAKRAMIAAINAGVKKAAPALTALKNSPANVRSAMRTLIGYDNSFKSTISKSSSLSNLESRLLALTNSKITAAASTVTAYITAQCGASALPTTTTVPAG